MLCSNLCHILRTLASPLSRHRGHKPRVSLVEVRNQDIESFVKKRLRYRERWHELHVGATSDYRVQPVRICGLLHHGAGLGIFELQTDFESLPPHTDGLPSEMRSQFLHRVCTFRRRHVPCLVALMHLQSRKRSGARDGRPSEGRDEDRISESRLKYLRASDRCADCGRAVGYTFCKDNHVGDDAFCVDAEECAGARKARPYFVDDEERALLLRESAHVLQKSRVRNLGECPASDDIGLGDNRRDIPPREVRLEIGEKLLVLSV